MIGKRIKQARKKRGYTQVQLAKACGISRSYLAGVEVGNYNPSVKTAAAIANALGVSIGCILDDAVPAPVIKKAQPEAVSTDGREITVTVKVVIEDAKSQAGR